MAEFVLYLEHRPSDSADNRRVYVAGRTVRALDDAGAVGPGQSSRTGDCQRTGEPANIAAVTSQHGLFGWDSGRVQDSSGGSDAVAFGAECSKTTRGSGDPLSGQPRS